MVREPCPRYRMEIRFSRDVDQPIAAIRHIAVVNPHVMRFAYRDPVLCLRYCQIANDDVGHFLQIELRVDQRCVGSHPNDRFVRSNFDGFASQRPLDQDGQRLAAFGVVGQFLDCSRATTTLPLPPPVVLSTPLPLTTAQPIGASAAALPTCIRQHATVNSNKTMRTAPRTLAVCRIERCFLIMS